MIAFPIPAGAISESDATRVGFAGRDQRRDSAAERMARRDGRFRARDGR